MNETKAIFVSVVDQTRMSLVSVARPSARAWMKATLSLWEQRSSAVQIDFKAQQQCHSNWCWAAIAASVASFFGRDKKFTQCFIANLKLRRSDCCDFPCHSPDAGPINVPKTLAAAINYTGVLTCEFKNTQASREKILDEMRANRPVCVRILWPDGSSDDTDFGIGAHYVAISGYDPITDKLLIEDPLYGPHDGFTYDEFRTNYMHCGGVWKSTIYLSAS